LPVIGEWPLTGRGEELEFIARATATSGDRPSGIVLSGVAGVGKTRLATEAVARCGPRTARRRWIVATASARGVPLGAFADIATNFGPDPLLRVREVINGLIGDNSNQTIIVGVDDAHLLDDLSAFAVHQLVTRRLATVILTIRSGERPPEAITAIWKNNHLQRFELQPLSQEGTAHLLERVLGGTVDSVSAQQFWQYTNGNALYLRHLLEDEVHDGRMAQHAGVWLWEGHPRLSPTLVELLEARMADVPQRACDVLDALAVAEPLEADVLEVVTHPDAIVEAESLGLITVDPGVRQLSVRLAHPLLGELRRSDSLRLRRLRGRIATVLAQKNDTDPRPLLRRAVLAMESDLRPDAELFHTASAAAMQLMDLRLAETLAQRAIAAGGGVEAELAHAMAIAWQERPAEAEAVLANLASRRSGPAQAQIAVLRAFNFAAIQGMTVSAERVLEGAPLADDKAAQAMAGGLRALIELERGQPDGAVERATAALAITPANDIARLVAIWAMVGGLGDLGRVDDAESAADAGYRIAATSTDASHLRMPLAALHAVAYRLAGELTALDATIGRVLRDTIDVPLQQAWQNYLTAMSAMSRGDLGAAHRSLKEALARLDNGGGGTIKGFSQAWLVTVTAMAGSAVDARRRYTAMQAVRWWDPEGTCEWDAEVAITEAWVLAAEGAVSLAISITRDAAATEAERGRSAWEVLLLQTATQFGDHTTATRLVELADKVQGPRAPAAAAHGTALAAGSGDGLIEASRMYEAFGDRIAAADAAAQAVVAFRNAGLRGAALTASVMARRLADECGGAHTPALRAATVPITITVRQREIISLAAQGLSNKEIAERLSMSVRSVQGHMFRASQRVGVNGRDELIAVLRCE
jgi:DNA-binding CsgD family transcriptional regulator